MGTKNESKKSDVLIGILVILGSVFVSAVLGLVFCLFEGFSWQNFFSCTKLMFIYFGAAGAVAGVLCLLGWEADRLLGGCAIAIWYGGAFLYDKVIGPLFTGAPESSAIALSYLVAFILTWMAKKEIGGRHD